MTHYETKEKQGPHRAKLVLLKDSNTVPTSTARLLATENPMIPDPTTKEGLEEVRRRAKKTKEFAKKMRELASQNPDDEPTGKLTHPNEADLHRDRKNKERVKT